MCYYPQDFQTQIPWPRKETNWSSLASATSTLLFASNHIVAALKNKKFTEVVVGVAMGRSATTELLGIASVLAWSADTENDRARYVKHDRDVLVTMYVSFYHMYHVVCKMLKYSM